MALAEPAKMPAFVCRFERLLPDGKVDESYRDFCAFEFPGCAGCPKAFHAIASVSAKEDPLKSIAWCGIQFAKLRHLKKRSSRDVPAQNK
jgi:hypothetical protein